MAMYILTKMKSAISFKTFLHEITDYDVHDAHKLVYKQLSLDDTIKHLQTDFSKCAWMVSENAPFYRGDPDHVTDAYAWVDSSKGRRLSQNTSNYYTLIFDNHPDRKNFPKRSSSLICTTSERTARDYDIHPLRIIPGNTAKIGLVNKRDMWNTEIRLFGKSSPIEEFNSRWNLIPSLSEYEWEAWEKFDKELKSGDNDALKHFYKAFPNADDDDHLHFLESILAAYGPQKTGHTSYTASELTPNIVVKLTEAWIGGPCLIIHEFTWKDLRDKFAETVR